VTASDPPRARGTARGRFGALDLLRGITVAAMIVVNNPGNWNSVYPQLLHSAWHGATVADLIFPGFIFIMGVAMSFTLTPAGDRQPQRSIYRRILIRSALLVLLGLVLNAAAAWPDIAAVRIPGVLQRIGVTYLFAALITRNTSDTQQWAWATMLLLVHWMILALPLGFAGSGVLDPGHNAAATVDRMLFGTHILTPEGDPEGALGVLSSVATALFGAAIGRWLLRDASRHAAEGRVEARGLLVQLTVAGTTSVVVGLAWSTVLPLNKPLWTGSFAVLACGVTTLLLVLVAAVTPPNPSPRSHPMLWLGTNPLAIYFLSELMTDLLQRPWLRVARSVSAPKDWFYWNLLTPLLRDGGGRLSSLAYALLYTAAWITVAGLMRWRGVRLRV
jgi:predicted acyltransferase